MNALGSFLSRRPATPNPQPTETALGVVERSLSPRMAGVARVVRAFGPTRFPVLVVGETGAGKEVVARALHETSGVTGPFVACNVAAVPGALLESELFGHERGAFSGASVPRQGLFRAAHGGTLFLDEIGEAPPAAQAALLRAIETGRVRPVGSDADVPAAPRIVSATHRPLWDMAAAGSFREDLLYRLGVLVVEVPPLRERPEDIPRLAEEFLRKNARTVGPAAFAPDGVRALSEQPWPGNVREMHGAIVRAALACGGRAIGADDVRRAVHAGRFAPDIAEPPAEPPDPEAVRRLRAMTADELRTALSAFGNVQAMAKRLGVARTTLRDHLRRSGVAA